MLSPVVKWVGGKSQIINELIKRLPKTYNKYFEPFIGGGALFFRIMPKEAHINDINKELIYLYQTLKSNNYKKLIKELDNHKSNHSEDYFYKIRSLDRSQDFMKQEKYIIASRLVYLNKSCYNGLYRVNKNGYFNTPSGKYEKVNIYDKTNLENIHKYLKLNKIRITNKSYNHVLKDAIKGDFIYFDPPYDKLNEKSFTSYDNSGFTKKDQKKLALVFKKLSEKGCFVMLSNHNTDYINELYKDYKIEVIQARRMINSNKDKRGEIEEVIIRNYE